VGKRLVHLVEDDATVRAMLTRLLESAGYAVRPYESGRALIDAIGTAGAGLEQGLILLDVRMPEPDGFAVRSALVRRGVELPVVMMSGSGDLTLLARQAGASDFMQKPFGRAELLDVLGQPAPAGDCDA
jgi:two-component system response regulator FixJ